MREVIGNELLEGSDHEFVVNLYTVVLNRWPDEEGYRHHLEKVENRPGIRREVIEQVAGSPEARNLGVALRWTDGEAGAPAPAPAAAPGDLAAALAALREAAPSMDAAALAEAQRLLAETIAALAALQARAIAAGLESRPGLWSNTRSAESG